MATRLPEAGNAPQVALASQRVTNEEANRLAREKGVSRPLYASVRTLIVPFMRTYFRMHIAGAEHIPAEGPAIVAPNHKSFYDSFFIAACTRRQLRFMAKSELIEARSGRLLVRLGAFPVRRGQSDADAVESRLRNPRAPQTPGSNKQCREGFLYTVQGRLASRGWGSWTAVPGSAGRVRA